MTENRKYGCRAGTAFTLTEMLVVLGILGLFFGIGVPVLVSFMRQNEVERASSMVRMAAVRARTMAIESRKNHVLVLDAEDGRIWIATEEEYREYEADEKDLGEVILDEPQYMPGPVRLVLGDFPKYLVFAPSGGLTRGTTPQGFNLVGTTILEGTATSGGNTNTIVDSGASWQEDRFRGYCVIIMNSGSSYLVGQRRGVSSNDENTITVNSPWLNPSEVPVSVPSGTGFAVVAPNELRNVVIYSTTGQVRVKTPPPCN